jgi:hypothetical protein
MAINDFPAAIAATIQSGFLDREFEEGLDSILAYRLCALQETIPARIGETLTRTRKSRLAPTVTPLVPSAVAANIDNSLTPQSFTMEQYSFTVYEYAQTFDVDLLAEMVGIADQMIVGSRNNGVAAAQSLERLAKQALFAAYNGGNTFVRTDLGASTTTTCHVDDIRGFQNVLVNGVVTPVSATNKLTVVETQASSGGVSQTLLVSGVVADSVSASIYPGSTAGATDGISGTLTFDTATDPVSGDALVAANAPRIFRPSGKITTTQLAAGDVLTMGLVLNAVAYLRDNGVPAMPDGSYKCILDNSSMRALFADQDFKVLFAGRDMTTEFRSADIVNLLGVEFIPTTEAYVQAPSTVPTPALAVTVRRPIIIGAEALLQGTFEGLEQFINRPGFEPIGYVMMVNDVAQIVRPPLDRLQRTCSMTWTWVGGFAVPTDLTATTSIIPTSSNALYKRCAVLEVAG